MREDTPETYPKHSQLSLQKFRPQPIRVHYDYMQLQYVTGLHPPTMKKRSRNGRPIATPFHIFKEPPTCYNSLKLDLSEQLHDKMC